MDWVGTGAENSRPFFSTFVCIASEARRLGIGVVVRTDGPVISQMGSTKKELSFFCTWRIVMYANVGVKDAQKCLNRLVPYFCVVESALAWWRAWTTQVSLGKLGPGASKQTGLVDQAIDCSQT